MLFRSTGIESLPCRSLLISTGTHPHQFLEQEGLFLSPNIEEPGVFLSYKGEPKVSFFGDLHPIYEGNVVKAMASAKNGYPRICEALLRTPPSAGGAKLKKLLQNCQAELVSASNKIPKQIRDDSLGGLAAEFRKRSNKK